MTLSAGGSPNHSHARNAAANALAPPAITLVSTSGSANRMPVPAAAAIAKYRVTAAMPGYDPLAHRGHDRRREDDTLICMGRTAELMSERAASDDRYPASEHRAEANARGRPDVAHRDEERGGAARHRSS